jgi:elongation factor G
MSAQKTVSMNAKNRKFPMEYTRNIGIAAHIDAGKTTTTERILYYTGVVHKMGEVHEGSSVTDWMEQERERGITITSAAISCNWTSELGLYKGVEQQINIIDTPGHVDFTAEVERSLRVLDGAVGVFCAVAGVQPQSETVWRQMDKYKVPRIAFINKMDRVGADFKAAIDSMHERLNAKAQAIYTPIGSEESFEGLIDLVEQEAIFFDVSDDTGMRFRREAIPEALEETAKQERESLVETLADFDEDLANAYLEGEPIAPKLLRQVIRKATVALDFCPVIPGSAFKNKGVQMLLDSIVDYLPSPIDLPAIEAEDLKGKAVRLESNDQGQLAGLAFKLMNDSFVGKLVFFRVYSGCLKKGAALLNPRTGKTERIARILLMKANSREDIDIAYSGDICALVGLRQVVTGDTLCEKSHALRLEPPTFPETVISMSIEPKTSADKDKLEEGLERLSEEDPTFIVSINEDTGQTLIAGMGELHLEIIRDRLFREFKVQAEAGRPQIAYRETFGQAAKGEGRFIRQAVEVPQYGHACIEVEPLEQGSGFIVEDKLAEGVIPKEFIEPTLEGIREAAHNGIVAGYPVTDFKATLVDGSFHEVDSSELAFKMAGMLAFKEAMEASNPQLLEPMMQVEVETPEEYQGDIMGDLNRRRGQIQSINSKALYCVISAIVPLSEMFGYSTTVRSLSKGRAGYSMNPESFQPVPENLLKQIVGTH